MKQLDAWAKEQMATWRIPGMVIGVYRGGKAEHVAAYGYADLEHDVPMKRESVCEICSISKQFTAACVLLLQEEGKLGLNDPAAKRLPHMPPKWSEVTIAELLHHTSGINDDRFDLHEPELTEEVLTKAATTGSRARGEAWEILEPWPTECSGMWSPTSAANRSSISYKRASWNPLGLTNTHPNSNRIIPNRVHGYGLDGDVLINAPTLSDKTGGGAGGLASTIDDLNRWSIAVTQGEVLSPESRAAMLTPGLLTSGDIARPPWSPGGYGLGVNVYSANGRRVEKHAGGWDDASAQLTRLLDDDLTVAILTNFGGWLLRPWVGEIVASMFVPDFQLPKHSAQPDPNPARLAIFKAAFQELASGALSLTHVSPRLHAQWSIDLKGWWNDLKSLDLESLEFAERIAQGARELIIYRQEAPMPTAVVAGFSAEGRLDSLTVGPIPQP